MLEPSTHLTNACYKDFITYVKQHIGWSASRRKLSNEEKQKCKKLKNLKRSVYIVTVTYRVPILPMTLYHSPTKEEKNNARSYTWNAEVSASSAAAAASAAICISSSPTTAFHGTAKVGIDHDPYAGYYGGTTTSSSPYSYTADPTMSSVAATSTPTRTVDQIAAANLANYYAVCCTASATPTTSDYVTSLASKTVDQVTSAANLVDYYAVCASAASAAAAAPDGPQQPMSTTTTTAADYIASNKFNNYYAAAAAVAAATASLDSDEGEAY